MTNSLSEHFASLQKYISKPPIVAAGKLIRGIGMKLAGQLPGAKDEIMKRALGLTGHLPDLARQKVQ